MEVPFEVEGIEYRLAEPEAVLLAEELRRVKRGPGSVPAADRIERVLVGADDGPVRFEGDAENVEVQRGLEICFLMPGSERLPHVLALFNALRRERGDPEFHPPSSASP